MNYYNELDPKAAAWLRELIKQGLIPPGDVDERSIKDVSANDLRHYTQCHFFAGVGGWSLALQLAGWPGDKPVWTGSCPCQPFSNAGKQLGTSDDRHLWPVFRELIRKRRPATVFGEQVASKAGREWYSGVRADMEGMDYASGAADLCAACIGENGEGWVVRGGKIEVESVAVGSPNIRQRLFWVGITNSAGWEQRQLAAEGARYRSPFESNGSACRLGDSHGSGLSEQCRAVSISPEQPPAELRGDASDLPAVCPRCCESAIRAGIARSGAICQGCGGIWSNFDILPCRDGKARRVESGTFPLAHGVPGRVGLLRGYGNAIVPQVAAEFIKAFCEAEGINPNPRID